MVHIVNPAFTVKVRLQCLLIISKGFAVVLMLTHRQHRQSTLLQKFQMKSLPGESDGLFPLSHWENISAGKYS